ncbi:MAG: hypothetical protein V8S24_12625 [Gordonibacter pamelaeae]
MKSIYINNCNPLNYVVDRQTLIKVFDKMELVVTARHPHDRHLPVRGYRAACGALVRGR